VSAFDPRYLNTGLFYANCPVIKVQFPATWSAYTRGTATAAA
jgi:hypothetical protein